MINIILVGLSIVILLCLPFLLIKQPIKKLATLSIFIALLFFLFHFISVQTFFPLDKRGMAGIHLISFSYSIAFSTIALLPMAIKATSLLWKHEIRLFDYVRYSMVFLLVVLLGAFNEFLSFVTSFTTALRALP